MKRSCFFNCVFLWVCTIVLFACSDEVLLNGDDALGDKQLFLTINLPVDSRLQSDQQNDGGFDSETSYQRWIKDILVLEFDHKDRLIHVVNPLNGSLDENPIKLTGKLLPAKENVKLVVLANLQAQQGELADISAESLLDEYRFQDKKSILSKLVYSYPAEGVWTLTADKKEDDRPLPMWGEIPEFQLEHQNIKGCDLYRAVAKMGIKVDESCKDFQLKKVFIYYAQQKGYCAPIHQIPGENQFTSPEVPDNSSRFGIDHPLEYTLSPSEQEKNEFFNQIYVAESDNKNLKREESPLMMVVGGSLGDDPAIRYYRIDMVGKNNGKMEPFDIIRNHSYVFTVVKVLGKGEDDPEKAMPHLVVKVDDYTDVFMRGVPDQYTLRTDKSIVRLKDHKDMDTYEINVFTDFGEGWFIEKDDAKYDWFTVTPENAQGGVECKLHIQAVRENRGTTKEGAFYIVAGNIRKEIKILMPQADTANCYIVGEGDHELVVTIKGNGKEGVFAEGGISLIPGLDVTDPEAIEEFVNLKPAFVKVIWETHPNLVTLRDHDGNIIENGPIVTGKGSRAFQRGLELSEGENVVKYHVKINSTNASIGGARGGNALIGAFDKEGKIIWSWHIWIAPDMLDKNGKIKEECVEKWKVNDYDVLDRNLGALANRPIDNNDGKESSVASMGLLYQWGRKDPFIGASYSKGHVSNDAHIINRGLLYVYHYFEPWGKVANALDDAASAIDATIQNPTQLIYTEGSERGLSFLSGIGQYLWGVSDGLNPNTKNLGIKTIYDPCPAGFRVPPVDAFVFKALDNEYKWRPDNLLTTIRIGQNETKVLEEYKDVPIIYYTMDAGFKTKEHFVEKGGIVINEGWGQDNLAIYAARWTRSVYSSANKNWAFNLVFIPHYDEKMEPSKYQYVNDPKYNPLKFGFGDKTPDIYTGRYVMDAPYYGFYLNYAKAWGEPKLEPVTREGTIEEKPYNSKGNYYYKIKETKDSTYSWFPLTAVYNPNRPEKELDLTQILIQKGPSVTVNSFLWTNTTVLKQTGFLPAAMFLHGTEYEAKVPAGHRFSKKNGRHIHALLANNIEAKPQYAGAVRPIRDRKKTIWDTNYLAKETTIEKRNGAKTEITIISVNADWKLVKPGAPWIKVTPDRGHADNGKGQTITLTMIDDKLAEVGAKTTLEFHIEGVSFNRVVTVEVVDNKK